MNNNDEFRDAPTKATPTPIYERHCHMCGETDLECINPYSQYSSCCGEGIMPEGDDDCESSCFHK